MRIGVIGSASVGWELGTRFASAGHEVLITNSRGPQSLKDRIAGAGVSMTAAPMPEAMASEAVLLALPWTKVREVLTPDIAWNGRILIDATNIFLSYAPDYRRDDLGDDFGSEIIARLAPGARVVKAFNTLPISTMFAPLPAGGLKRALFIAGDDQPALDAISRLVADAGLAPVAAGTLAIAGRQMELGGGLSLLELFAAEKDARA